MDTQTAILVIQLFTLLVTIGGWIYTGGQQKSILRESRQYQRKDRDLAVYRTRMDKASELTKSLIEHSNKWYKLGAFAKAALDEGIAREFQTMALPLLQEAVNTRIEIALILYDPQFRTLRNLLRPELGKKLYDSLKASSSQLDAFYAKTYNLSPTDKDIKDQVRFIFDEGIKIGDKLVEIADHFADAFAMLDQELTKESS